MKRRRDWEEEKREERKLKDNRIQRLFENPRREFIDRPYFTVPKEEKKYYQLEEKSKNNNPFDLPELTNLIYQYTLPEELGTPREKCYSNQKNSSCEENIESLEILRKVSLDNFTNIDFSSVECAIYCLLTNLPTFIDVIINNENEEEDEENEIPFDLYVTVMGNESIMVRFFYNENSEKHEATVSIIDKETRIASVDVGEAIDIVLYYGSRSKISFVLPIGKNEVFNGFDDETYWDELANLDSQPFLTTFA
jgi:hypothetical protein